MTIKFLRNKVLEVEPQADGNLAVSWRLTDDLLKMNVQLLVQIPEMEIIEADAVVSRFPPQGCLNASELIKKTEGINIGSGLRKIINGLLGGSDGCSLLVDAVLESSNAVILHFTRPGIEIMEAVTDPEDRQKGFQAMLQANPRLVRSCISFQDDSPLLKGLDLTGD